MKWSSDTYDILHIINGCSLSILSDWPHIVGLNRQGLFKFINSLSNHAIVNYMIMTAITNKIVNIGNKPVDN